MNLPLLRLAGAALLVVASGSSHALFKVVGPDGSVTYTDRAPQAASARVTSLGRGGTEPAPAPTPQNALPMELRQVASRFPVVLYTAPDCTPCGAAREWLQQRGLPYAERVADSEEGALALERAVGGRSVPAATIGSQVLRGFSAPDWSAYADAAGYPKESRLPRGWAPPPAEPLVARVPAKVASPRPAPVNVRPPEPAAPVEAAPTAANPGGLRF